MGVCSAWAPCRLEDSVGRKRPRRPQPWAQQLPAQRLRLREAKAWLVADFGVIIPQICNPETGQLDLISL